MYQAISCTQKQCISGRMTLHTYIPTILVQLAGTFTYKTAGL